MPTGGDDELARLARDVPAVAELLDEYGPAGPSVPALQRPPRAHRPRGPRTPLLVGVLLVALLGLRLGWPHIVTLTDYLVNGDPTFRVGASAGPVPEGGRMRAAAPLPDTPDPDEYAYIDEVDTDVPVTFDPCRPIHYVVHDPYDLGDTGRDAIADAVAEVSDATGLAFVFDGYTDEKPSRSRSLRMPQYERQWAPVLIAWSDPKETPRLDGSIVGLGGPRESDRPTGRRSWVTGTIELDTPTLGPWLGSPLRRADAHGVIVHELGHVLGADHPVAGDQLMSAQNGPGTLQDGDRYAFARLGSGPCLR
ncbi:hypothetical protein [Arthrobacter sp. NEB 688]|uniref:hypothetical protein n=1 Tax=Arthrobacter sp. NEB 688 TaxID=904039 RepID=UPI0015663C11|nr:hypothetical protein [Arthrobacter sp. NEB 688]QKE84411.1 hypothetical protein HL663_11010 [Arthrobacter sp. NEB 688]